MLRTAGGWLCSKTPPGPPAVGERDFSLAVGPVGDVRTEPALCAIKRRG